MLNLHIFTHIYHSNKLSLDPVNCHGKGRYIQYVYKRNKSIIPEIVIEIERAEFEKEKKKTTTT